MKTVTVTCHELIDGKKVLVGTGELLEAETLEDIILMTESGECPEKDAVTHFNASRRIRKQAQLKAGTSDKVTKTALVGKLEAMAKSNEALKALLLANGLTLE